MKTPYVALKTRLPWPSGVQDLSCPHSLEDVNPLHLLVPMQKLTGCRHPAKTLALAASALPLQPSLTVTQSGYSFNCSEKDQNGLSKQLQGLPHSY